MEFKQVSDELWHYHITMGRRATKEGLISHMTDLGFDVSVDPKDEYRIFINGYTVYWATPHREGKDRSVLLGPRQTDGWYERERIRNEMR